MFKLINYEKPGHDAPRPKGIRLFFELYLENIWPLFKLNLIYVLLCLPIVTMGAATVAFYRVTNNIVLDKPQFHVYEFFTAFKENFLKNTLFQMVYLLIFITLMGLNYFYSNVYVLPSMTFVSIVIALFLITFTFYAYPMLASVELPIKKIIKNAILLSFLGLKTNILMYAVIGALVILPYTASVVVLLLGLLLIIPATVTFTISFGTMKVIRKYVTKD